MTFRNWEKLRVCLCWTQPAESMGAEVREGSRASEHE